MVTSPGPENVFFDIFAKKAKLAEVSGRDRKGGGVGRPLAVFSLPLERRLRKKKNLIAPLFLGTTR